MNARGAVPRIEHLRAENQYLLALERPLVPDGKLPHQAGDAGAIDGIAHRHLHMGGHPGGEIGRLLDGMTLGLHTTAEGFGDIPGIPRPGKYSISIGFPRFPGPRAAVPSAALFFRIVCSGTSEICSIVCALRRDWTYTGIQNDTLEGCI